MSDISESRGLLIVPRIRIQNANIISAPLTWGFPSITAFIGAMWALERKIGSRYSIIFRGVGLVCHSFEPQTAGDRYTHSFNLTRNPLAKDEKTAAIVEEGRAHIEVSLIFAIDGAVLERTRQELENIASEIAVEIARMRLAGGSVIPITKKHATSFAKIIRVDSDAEKRFRQTKYLFRSLLPGFALVLRHDLLQAHFEKLRQSDSTVSMLDAWLDMSRVNWRANPEPKLSAGTLKSDDRQIHEWTSDLRFGWTVPIPIGYVGLSEKYQAGMVQNARDCTSPFQFVESIYSIGQWISPHRLDNVKQLMWYAETDQSQSIYRCSNSFVSAPVEFSYR